MANRHAALREVRQLITAHRLGAQLSDEQLLHCFLTHRDEAAFAALIERHGPMVVSVCRSVLRHPQDAEDAAQAAFLVLARKAASIRQRSSVASWLHGVAFRVARKAKAAKLRVPPGQTEGRSSPCPMDEATVGELRQALHDELGRLPEKYRLPLILCYLEGLTQEEAARRLDWTAGVLKGNLDRGRALLRRRLTRRGLALGVPLLVESLTRGSASAALPDALVAATARSAALILSEEVAHAGVVTKLRLAALALVVVASGVGLAALGARGEKEPPTATAKPIEPAARVDQHGDDLPPRAVARVGSVRWWHWGDQDCPLVYTPDGKSLVCCDRGAILVLDVATGKERLRLRPPGEEATSFALSPDGKTLVTASLQRVTLRVWDVSTGQETRQFTATKGGTSAVAFSPDGKTFAAAVGRLKDIQLWNVATWKETRRLRGQVGLISSLCFLPDGKTLISGGGTCKDIYWWDAAAGREIRQLAASLGHRRTLVTSPDGKWLAGVVEPNLLHIWDAATGARVRRAVLSEDHAVWCLCFSPDSRTLACGNAVGGRANQTLFFAAATAKELRRWDETSYTTRLAYSPDGKVLAQAASGVIRLRDPVTGRAAVALPGLSDYVMGVRFTPDGKRLIASCYGGRTGAWDPFTGKPLAPPVAPPKAFAGRPDILSATALSPDGRKAAAVDAEGALHVWETATGKALSRIHRPPVTMDQPDFSPDGRTLVVKHDDNVIRVWDAATGQLRCSLAHPPNRLFPHPHAFSPDGRVVATAPDSRDKKVIRLWDAATGKQTGRLTWEDNTTPTCLLFSADGKALVASHGGRYDSATPGAGVDLSSNSIRVWNLASGREASRFRASAGDIRALALSPDGKTLAVGAHDNLALWDTLAGSERGVLKGHKERIWSLAFSPDGRLLASGSLDYTALVWDVTGDCPDGKWSPRDASPNELERLWEDLASADGQKAYRAVWAMAAGRPAARYLSAKLKPVPPVEDKRLARLIADLDSDEFDRRERASVELGRLDELAASAITKALAAKPTPEARRRLERLVQSLAKPALSADELRNLRAVEALEHIASPEARRVLSALADGAPEARLTKEAKAAISRLSKARP